MQGALAPWHFSAYLRAALIPMACSISSCFQLQGCIQRMWKYFRSVCLLADPKAEPVMGMGEHGVALTVWSSDPRETNITKALVGELYSVGCFRVALCTKYLCTHLHAVVVPRKVSACVNGKAWNCVTSSLRLTNITELCVPPLPQTSVHSHAHTHVSSQLHARLQGSAICAFMCTARERMDKRSTRCWHRLLWSSEEGFPHTTHL